MTADEQHDDMDVGGLEQEREPRVIDEIEVEDLAVDGICGVY